MTSWARRSTVTAASLTLLFAIVGLAAREPLDAAGSGSAPPQGQPLAPLVLVLLGGALLLLGLMVAILWRSPRRRGDDEEPPRVPTPIPAHWAIKLISVVVPLALGAAVVVGALAGLRSAPQPQTVAPRSGRPLAHATPTSAVHTGSTFAVPGWLPWVLAALLVGGAGSAVVIVLRSSSGHPQPAGQDQAARGAVEAAIASLRDPADPREAVIRAYTRMEQELAAHQLGRREPEAPREYLGRVLRDAAAVPEPALTELTTLFEEARFSRHPIAPSAPQRALRLLGELQQALTADPPS